MLKNYSVLTLLGAANCAPSLDQDHAKFPGFATTVQISTSDINSVTGAVKPSYIGATATTPGSGPLRGLRNDLMVFPT